MARKGRKMDFGIGKYGLGTNQDPYFKHTPFADLPYFNPVKQSQPKKKGGK